MADESNADLIKTLLTSVKLFQSDMAALKSGAIGDHSCLRAIPLCCRPTVLLVARILLQNGRDPKREKTLKRTHLPVMKTRKISSNCRRPEVRL